MTAAARWLIVGAGYTGARVAAALAARGDAVVVTRRTAVDAAAVAAQLGVAGVALDLTTATVDDLRALIGAGTTVVITAPPSDGGGGAEARLAVAAAAAGARRIVYVSSTGVYAAAGGDWVDEDFALAPSTASGRARLAAERALAAGSVPCVRLRAAGIYGPDRGVVARMRAGTYRLVGPGDTHVSRVHVDDLVAAVVLAGDAPAPGPVYNVADRDPCTSRELAGAVAAALDLPVPPTVALDQVGPDVAGMFTADRKIDSRRLERELGWTPRFPSWRTALGAELSWC